MQQSLIDELTKRIRNLEEKTGVVPPEQWYNLYSGTATREPVWTGPYETENKARENTYTSSEWGSVRRVKAVG